MGGGEYLSSSLLHTPPHILLQNSYKKVRLLQNGIAYLQIIVALSVAQKWHFEYEFVASSHSKLPTEGELSRPRYCDANSLTGGGMKFLPVAVWAKVIVYTSSISSSPSILLTKLVIISLNFTCVNRLLILPIPLPLLPPNLLLHPRPLIIRYSVRNPIIVVVLPPLPSSSIGILFGSLDILSNGILRSKSVLDFRLP